MTVELALVVLLLIGAAVCVVAATLFRGPVREWILRAVAAVVGVMMVTGAAFYLGSWYGV